MILWPSFLSFPLIGLQASSNCCRSRRFDSFKIVLRDFQIGCRHVGGSFLYFLRLCLKIRDCGDKFLSKSVWSRTDGLFSLLLCTGGYLDNSVLRDIAGDNQPLPPLTDQLWRRGWTVWSCQRPRARMAQFIVEQLHGGVNGRSVVDSWATLYFYFVRWPACIVLERLFNRNEKHKCAKIERELVAPATVFHLGCESWHPWQYSATGINRKILRCVPNVSVLCLPTFFSGPGKE